MVVFFPCDTLPPHNNLMAKPKATVLQIYYFPNCVAQNFSRVMSDCLELFCMLTQLE